MVHLVYFSPDVIGEDFSQEARQSLLIGTLLSLLQNCLLLDYIDYRFDAEIRDLIGNLPSDCRKRVQVILSSFAKNNRIVRILEDDYSGKSDLEILVSWVSRVPLELVIEDSQKRWDAGKSKVPSETIETFPMSDFERGRSANVVRRDLASNSITGQGFIDQFLAPVFRYAEEIHIVDFALGVHFHDDFATTVAMLLASIAKESYFKKTLTVTFHVGVGLGRMSDHVKQVIEEAADRNGMKGQVAIKIYPDRLTGSPRPLPHDRYLSCEIGSVDIGRGFDFIDTRTKMINNTSVSLSTTSPVEVLRLL